ncbi:hypothetical protein KEG38_23570 [Polyangium jinanense]|uniref:hypothetical protein n=1 Tax=Polyangium jinanense TaxID=2829994 RepID=UPI002342459F|nr:hypothetical protein [Polyangium jinanense]MDC3956859.1 hypothetical protein [Polyangium jinanense]
MGRSLVTLSNRWRDCTRCARHQRRLAVYAPVWPEEVEVVVLGAGASRAVQAAQTPGPDLLVVVEALQRELGLSEKTCIADYLAACGMGTRLTADEVAACAQRFVQHAASGAGPKVIVFFGQKALGVAFEAGLVDADGLTWRPVGATVAKVVTIEDHRALGKGIQRVARLLQKNAAPMRKENRGLLSAKAQDLLHALGDHTGHGVLEAEASWNRSKRGRLSIRHVQAHLAGKYYVAPFHPKGSWPFVVIDVDRHNAVQEAVFPKTLGSLQKLFPKSVAIRSSPSGGIHFYVRLPPGLSYADGALVLRAFVTLHKLRWHHAGHRQRSLRAEIVEVPEQPVRLPFGHGSFLLGSSKALHEQFDEYIQFIRRADHDDFDKASRYVGKKLKLGGHSLLVRRGLLLKSMLAEEVRGLPRLPLGDTDPWQEVIKKLPDSLQIIAASGIPAYGTRHRWTRALVEHLVDLVPPENVRSLMRHWLHNRDHVSEDWEVDPALVERQTVTIINGIYKKLHGVPEEFWSHIEQHILATFQLNSRPRVGSNEHSLTAGRTGWNFQFELEDIVRTVFFIARRFFDLGRRERTVSFREFGRFVGKDNARVMRRMIVGMGAWLWQTASAEPGKHARIYRLTDAVWPPTPGPRLFCPPIRDASKTLF